MRIIGGKYRGAILANVGKGDISAQLRPTADRVRENIFNLLINGGYGDLVEAGICIRCFCGNWGSRF
jgi:16S rRNA (guanine966-N2)-methyltransferase